MTIQIITADKDSNAAQIRELFLEYLQWVNAKVNEEFGINFNTEAIVDTDMQNLAKFMPPNGRILLCIVEDHLSGIACLKYLEPGIGEIKRMYVRPESRKSGLGRAMINRLVAEAIQIGYERIRLDSARFMEAAHQLYRTIGFSEIAAYKGSEIPKEWQANWIFMEMDLRGMKAKDEA